MRLWLLLFPLLPPYLSKLTLGASVHAERGASELDLGRAVLEVPLLLRGAFAGLAVWAQTFRLAGYGFTGRCFGGGHKTYTMVVLPVVRAFATITNLGSTFDVMYTAR